LSSTGLAGAPAAGSRQAVRRAAGLVSGRLLWVLGTAAAAVVLFTCYLLQSRSLPAGSNGGSIALQAWDMLHGNPLLRDWSVANVTFYTTELPQYMLIESFRGLSADVIHVGGAMTYTLLVLLAAFLARGRSRGLAGLVRAVLTAGIMLAPQLGSGTAILLLGPDHIGTAAPVLAMLLLVDLAGRRWYVPVLVWLVLAWVLVGDELVAITGAIPLAIVCAVRVYQGAVRHREGLRAQWYELSLAAAAILAIPAGLAGIALVKALGGWQTSPLQTSLVSGSTLAGNFRLTGQGLLELFGADPFDAGSGSAVVFAAAHLFGVAVVVWGFCAAVRRFFRRDGIIESVLVTAIVLNVAAFVAIVAATDVLSAKEIGAVLPFGAVLAGRMLGDRALAERAGLALGVVLTGYAAMLGYSAAQPAQAPQYANLTAWLRANHLTSGVSGFAQANIVTVQSGGAVSLRPVTAQGLYIQAQQWQAKSSWYDPTQRASFLILRSYGAYEVREREAVATFGPPARTYRFREWTILVWNENIYTHLR
jgi:hypothetical protein